MVLGAGRNRACNGRPAHGMKYPGLPSQIGRPARLWNYIKRRTGRTNVTVEEVLEQLRSGIKIVDLSGNKNDYAYSLQLDDTGNIYVAGYTESASTGDDFAVLKLKPDGTADTTFGTLGVVIVDLSGNNNDKAYSLQLDDDGNIYVGGYTYSGSNHDFAVLKLDSNGNNDTSFGTLGVAIVDLSGNNNEVSYSLQLDDDGNIYVGGYTYSGSNFDFAVLKLKPDGITDTSFGTLGVAIIDLSGGYDYARSLQLDDDGNIYVGGYTDSGSNYDFAVLKLDSSGNNDESFGVSGVAIVDLSGNNNDQAYSLQLDDDGNIYVAGYTATTGTDFAVLKLKPDGTTDASFGTLGVAIMHPFGFNDDARSLQLDDAGNIYVGGYTDGPEASDKDFAVLKLKPDGTADTSFGTLGVAIVDVFGLNDDARSLQLDDAGNIYVGGYTYSGSEPESRYDFAILKLKPDGTLATDFGELV